MKATPRNSVFVHLAALLLVISLSFFKFPAYSQETKTGFLSTLYLETQAHYGFLIPHHREMWALTDGFFTLYEISMAKQTFGRQPGQSDRNYPQLRLTYLTSDFGKSKPLGKLHAVIPNIRLPLLKGKKSGMMFGFGLGIGHLSNKFHVTENYQNLAIGSHYNAAIQFTLSWRVFLSDRLYFNGGASMLHISNGTIKSPNFGLNIPAIFGGLNWKLNKKPINYLEPDQQIKRKGKINMRLQGLVATKQILSQPESDFGVITGNLSISRYYNNVNNYLIGLDVIYDESTKFLLEEENKPTDEWQDIVKLGLFGGHEWTFSQIGVLIGLGYYLENNNPNDTPVYTKMEVNYNFVKFAFAGISLRTHWAKADFLSAGIGFKL